MAGAKLPLAAGVFTAGDGDEGAGERAVRSAWVGYWRGESDGDSGSAIALIRLPAL